MLNVFDMRWGIKPLLANPDPGGGDGGGGTRPFFSISPTQPWSLGNTIVGTPINLIITIKNVGTAGLIISAITIAGAGFTKSGIVLPKTIAVDASTTFTITFNPSSAGNYLGTCTITHNAVGSPYTANLSGSAVAPLPGGGALSIFPTQVVFPDTAVNTTSLPQMITLSNVGTGPLKINSFAFTTGVHFQISIQPQKLAVYRMRQYIRKQKKRLLQWVSMARTTPTPIVLRSGGRKTTRWTAYPFFHSQYDIILAPGDSIQIGITFTPLLLHFLSDTLLVQTDTQANPFPVPLQGYGVLLIPIAIITSNIRAVLLGYVDANQVVNHRTIDPTDLNSEVASSFTPNGNLWNMPGIEKQLNQIEFYYENLGVATLTVSITAHRPGAGADNYQTVTATMVIGTAAADGTERSAMCDLIISGEILTMTVSRAALGGPVSIIGYIPHFEERGEKVENS